MMLFRTPDLDQHFFTSRQMQIRFHCWVWWEFLLQKWQSHLLTKKMTSSSKCFVRQKDMAVARWSCWNFFLSKSHHLMSTRPSSEWCVIPTCFAPHNFLSFFERVKCNDAGGPARKKHESKTAYSYTCERSRFLFSTQMHSLVCKVSFLRTWKTFCFSQLYLDWIGIQIM